MGLDLKYGTVFHAPHPEDAQLHDAEGIELLGQDGEPVMVFRAQDKLTVPLIARYENLYVATQPDGFDADNDPFILSVRAQRDAFHEWQQANPDKTKLPD